MPPNQSRSRPPIGWMILLAIILGSAWAAPCSGIPLFRAQHLTLTDRPLAVMPADLDDRGAAEILVVSRTGTFPTEKRWISVYRANEALTYHNLPVQHWELDADATMFEVGDVAPFPGKEIFFLTSRGIRYYGQADGRAFSTFPRLLLETPTAAGFPAAGLLPRTRLLGDWRHTGQETMLVPQLGALVFFNRNGSEGWRKAEQIAMVPRTFLYGDQEDNGVMKSFAMRMDYRIPRIFTRDLNGDDRSDLLLMEQDAVSVHYGLSDGKFSHRSAASFLLPVRPPGYETDWDLSLLGTPEDINQDGFADIILTRSHGTGRLLERQVDVLVFYNQKTGDLPFPEKPDQAITFRGITPGVRLRDVNKDGFPDMVFSHIELGFWNTVKNLVSKQVDVHTSVYLFRENRGFQPAPDYHAGMEYRLDLTRGIEFNGTWPNTAGDFNRDGFPDLLIARDNTVTVLTTSPSSGVFAMLHHQEDVITCPHIHITDLNRDGLDDVVMYEKRRDGSVSILLNNGKWETDKNAGGQAAYTDR